MKVLVTGAAGFIGSFTSKKLFRQSPKTETYFLLKLLTNREKGCILNLALRDTEC